MNHEIWQRLLQLESRDNTSKWYEKIHERELSAKRAREIGASARQASEFFKNAFVSNNSVRPLLTFYGVACLARAITLLLKRNGGEEGLTMGHGLKTIEWNHHLSGNLTTGLEALGDIRISTCRGMFLDMANETKNRIPIHTRSESVDWRINYDRLNLGDTISFNELLARIPDLHKEHTITGLETKYAAVNEITYSSDEGLRLKLPQNTFGTFKDNYETMGYILQNDGDHIIMTGTEEIVMNRTPQFIHTYIKKMFSKIPILFIVAPLPSGNTYSQLCFTYMVAYILGMLTRYYPTHWVSLTQGIKGDGIWPTINRAQHYVENAFPELAIELIEDVLADPLPPHEQQ